MNRSILSKLTAVAPSRRGFSLIEVVLAIGIFLVTVLALVGLLGPTLQSVDEVEKSDEVVSVVNTVNAFLQSSPDIAPGGSKFNAIYRAVESDDYATIFVFRRFVGSSTDVELAIGFLAEASVDPLAELDPDTDFDNVAGPLYRVVLSASSVTPESSLDSTTRTNGVYSLKLSKPAPDVGDPPNTPYYPEGYLAMEVRIYSEDWRPGYNPDQFADGTAVSLAELNQREPLFTYNTAVVR